MRSLHLLPPELLREVLSNLSPFDLEQVAKTFSKLLYYAAVKLLEVKKQWLKDTREALMVFPPGTSVSQRQLLSPYPDHIRPLAADWGLSRTEFPAGRCQDFHLDPLKAPYFRTSPSELGDWLTLDGKFTWLCPLPEQLARTMLAYQDQQDQPLAEEWQIDVLAQQAKELNLALPRGFETFMLSKVLHNRMASHFAWYFRLSRLIRCPAKVDGGHGGYLVRFYCDQQYCAFDYLYLSPSGNHFIIRSYEDFYIDFEDDTIVTESAADVKGRDNADEHGWSNDDVSLIGLNFEEHLASVYFEELLNFEVAPFPRLIEYVQHTYKSRE